MLSAARCKLESDGIDGLCSRDEQSLLQFVSCSVCPLECINMTHVTVQWDYKHRG